MLGDFWETHELMLEVVMTVSGHPDKLLESLGGCSAAAHVLGRWFMVS